MSVVARSTSSHRTMRLMPRTLFATLLTKVDAVMLESVDGRTHWAQAKQVIEAGKPLFIDKPLSSSYDEAKEIAKLAQAKGVKWFSSSSLRYADFLGDLKAKGPVK